MLEFDLGDARVTISDRARSVLLNGEEIVPRRIDEWSWLKQAMVWSIFGGIVSNMVTALAKLQS